MGPPGADLYEHRPHRHGAPGRISLPHSVAAHVCFSGIFCAAGRNRRAARAARSPWSAGALAEVWRRLHAWRGASGASPRPWISAGLAQARPAPALWRRSAAVHPIRPGTPPGAGHRHAAPGLLGRGRPRPCSTALRRAPSQPGCGSALQPPAGAPSNRRPCTERGDGRAPGSRARPRFPMRVFPAARKTKTTEFH